MSINKAKTKQELLDEIIKYCQKGDLETVKSLVLNTPIITPPTKIEQELADKNLINNLKTACQKGQLEKVKLLMKELNIDFSRPKSLKLAEDLYSKACFSGNIKLVDELIYLTDVEERHSFVERVFQSLLDKKSPKYYPVIEYLISEPRLEIKRAPPNVVPTFYAKINVALGLAAKDDNLPLAKILLNTNEPEKRNKWAFTTNLLFSVACQNGNSEVVKYLYTEPKFKNILNPYIGFVEACKCNNEKLIKFLMFDYKIEKTEQLEKYLKENGLKNIQTLLEKRDLNDELSKELINNPESLKRLKI